MGETSPENPADFFSLTHLFVSSNYRSLAKSMILANCPARKLVSQFKSVSQVGCGSVSHLFIQSVS